MRRLRKNIYGTKYSVQLFGSSVWSERVIGQYWSDICFKKRWIKRRNISQIILNRAPLPAFHKFLAWLRSLVAIASCTDNKTETLIEGVVQSPISLSLYVANGEKNAARVCRVRSTFRYFFFHRFTFIASTISDVTSKARNDLSRCCSLSFQQLPLRSRWQRR
jgi:hypothetical protein